MPIGTVLLVEDDPEVAQLLMAVMRMGGYDAAHARTSREALDFAILHQNEIALVVCDVRLLGDSGPAVVAKIRGFCPRIKTLFISGSSFGTLCEIGLLTPETLKNGDTGYIQKPFLPKDFAGAMRSLFDPLSVRSSGATQTGSKYARAAY
jgi:two-component system, cell cycle sensor histidine kinase and response regulator CckA